MAGRRMRGDWCVAVMVAVGGERMRGPGEWFDRVGEEDCLLLLGLLVLRPR
jgi:hypothetical protein